MLCCSCNKRNNIRGCTIPTIRPIHFDEICCRVSCVICRMVHDITEEAEICGDTKEDKIFAGSFHSTNGCFSFRCMDNQFRQHGVKVNPCLIPFTYPGIQSNAWACRWSKHRQWPNGRKESIGRILSINPNFNCMASNR